MSVPLFMSGDINKAPQQQVVKGLSLPIQDNFKIVEEEMISTRKGPGTPTHVSKLPLDILSTIFYILSVDKTSRWDWTVILFVCRAWYLCALECQTLWTSIDFFDQRKKVVAFLDRSKSANLVLKLETTNDIYNDRALTNFLLALEHLHRITHLMIRYSFRSRGWVDIFAALERPAPVLGHLSLISTTFDVGSSAPVIPATIFGGRFLSTLKSFHTRIFALPWDSPMVEGLSRLTHLSLRTLRDAKIQPTLTQLLDVLEICQDLIKLEIQDVGIKSVDTERTSRVRLPHLRYFLLDVESSQATSKILAFLNIPTDVEWSIVTSKSSRWESLVFIPQILDSHWRCARLEMSFRLSSARITAYNALKDKPDSTLSATKLHIYWRNESHFDMTRTDAIDDVCGIIQHGFWAFTQEVWIQMHHHDKRIPISTWRNLLYAFPEVHTLRLDICSSIQLGRPEEDLLKALMPPMHEPPCPELINLSLKWIHFTGQFEESFKKYLLFRKSQQSPLRQLSLREAVKCNAIMVDSFKELVDELDWDGIVRERSLMPGDSAFDSSIDHYAFT